MILQIRGTSGSGKTTLMRKLYAVANCKPIKVEKMQRGGEKVLLSKGEWAGLPFYVVGPYDMTPGATGGCDRISKIEQVVELVDWAAKRTQAKDGVHHTGIIAFEGLLLAHSWGQMGEFLHERYGHRYVNAFLDTTVDQCYKNVMARRKQSGNNKNDADRIAKIKKNVYDDYHRVELCYTRVIARGGYRVDIPYGPRSYAATAELIDAWALLYSGTP